MAKNRNRKAVSTSRTPAKQAGKFASVLTRPAARGDDRHSTAPRGAVSTKPVGRVRTFFREVRIEMKKVTWPPRKELIKSTGVVIVAVAIAAIFIGGLDALWNYLATAAKLG